MADGKIEWLYRVSKEEKKRLQNDIVANLDLLEPMEPHLYFFEDGRGVMTVRSPNVINFPLPPAPLSDRTLDLGGFGRFIDRLAQDLEGMTILPWGGGSVGQFGALGPLPSTKTMTVVSNNPSMLGVAGILGFHREQVDSVWTGFDESFR